MCSVSAQLSPAFRVVRVVSCVQQPLPQSGVQRGAAQAAASAPSFNYKGEAQPVLCAQHKLPLMVNLRARPCSLEGCDEEGRYTLPGRERAVVSRRV